MNRGKPVVIVVGNRLVIVRFCANARGAIAANPSLGVRLHGIPPVSARISDRIEDLPDAYIYICDKRDFNSLFGLRSTERIEDFRRTHWLTSPPLQKEAAMVPVAQAFLSVVDSRSAWTFTLAVIDPTADCVRVVQEDRCYCPVFGTVLTDA
jgi:hypothetical protein